MTCRNRMAVIRKIEAIGSIPVSVRLARDVFAELEARPQGLSIEERFVKILTKEEWEREHWAAMGPSLLRMLVVLRI